jgi:hypothetical protein
MDTLELLKNLRFDNYDSTQGSELASYNLVLHRQLNYIFQGFGDILENNRINYHKHQQLAACKELMEYGIIKMKYHGMPKKRYFKFDAVAFNKLYDDFRLHSNSPEEETEVPEALEVPHRNFSGFSF